MVVLKPVSQVALEWKIHCSCQFEEIRLNFQEATVNASLQETLLLCNSLSSLRLLIQKCEMIRRGKGNLFLSLRVVYVHRKCLQFLLDLRPFQSSLIQKLYPGSGKGCYQHLSVFFLLFIRLAFVGFLHCHFEPSKSYLLTHQMGIKMLDLDIWILHCNLKSKWYVLIFQGVFLFSGLT